MGLLQSLEQHFYRFTGETYDLELSRQVIDDMACLYEVSELERLPSILEDFVEANTSKLESLFNEYRGIEDRPLFLFQPEAFLILERLGIAWGKPLD